MYTESTVTVGVEAGAHIHGGIVCTTGRSWGSTCRHLVERVGRATSKSSHACKWWGHGFCSLWSHLLGRAGSRLFTDQFKGRLDGENNWSHCSKPGSWCHRVTWLLNCGRAPVPAAGHPPPAGPPWRGATVLEGGTEWEGVTECVTPFWRDIWASICPAEGPACAICGVICGVILTGLLRKWSSQSLLLLLYQERIITLEVNC